MDRAAISTTVTELPDSRVRVLAEVPPEELRRAIDRSARSLGRNLRVAGFRKGKVPPPVIIQRLGRDTVVDRAVQDGLKRWWRVALDGAGIASVGQPKLDVVTPPTDDAPLTFSIEIGVRPAAELGQYKGLEVGRRDPEIEPGAVDAELEALRVRVARPQSVSRPAQSGDLLVIDFNGLIDGEPFDGGRGRDQMVELGSGMLIAGFEEQLEGASTGELRDVNIDFPNVDAPKDHRAEDVAGSRATFEVARQGRARQEAARPRRRARAGGGRLRHARGAARGDRRGAAGAGRGARRRGVRRDRARRGRRRRRRSSCRARSSPRARRRSGRRRCARSTTTA